MILTLPTETFRSLSLADPASSVTVFALPPTVTTTLPLAVVVPRVTVTVMVGREPAFALRGALIEVVLVERVATGVDAIIGVGEVVGAGAGVGTGSVTVSMRTGDVEPTYDAGSLGTNVAW